MHVNVSHVLPPEPESAVMPLELLLLLELELLLLELELLDAWPLLEPEPLLLDVWPPLDPLELLPVEEPVDPEELEDDVLLELSIPLLEPLLFDAPPDPDELPPLLPVVAPRRLLEDDGGGVFAVPP